MVLSAFALLLLSSRSLSPDVLWQIGQAGDSYKDLAIAGQYRSYATRFPRDVIFTTGRS